MPRMLVTDLVELLEGTPLELFRATSRGYVLHNRYSGDPVFAATNLYEIRERITLLLGI